MLFLIYLIILLTILVAFAILFLYMVWLNIEERRLDIKRKEKILKEDEEELERKESCIGFTYYPDEDDYD